MVMYVTVRRDDQIYERGYHVGGGDMIELRKQMRHRIDGAEASTIELQADGHELDHIRTHFSNMPRSQSRIVTWEGEMARFIINNI